MSETRQFVNNLKNENGSPVYIEDKKLSERTTASGASSITSDFKFLLEHGSDGEFETALKAYVAEAIRAELGSILTNLDKGTSISSLAAISNGDLGSITPANLASVLGVAVRNNISKNVDNITSNFCGSATDGEEFGLPSNWGVFISLWISGPYPRLQVWMTVTGTLYIRMYRGGGSQIWTEWFQINS